MLLRIYLRPSKFDFSDTVFYLKFLLYKSYSRFRKMGLPVRVMTFDGS